MKFNKSFFNIVSIFKILFKYFISIIFFGNIINIYIFLIFNKEDNFLCLLCETKIEYINIKIIRMCDILHILIPYHQVNHLSSSSSDGSQVERMWMISKYVSRYNGVRSFKLLKKYNISWFSYLFRYLYFLWFFFFHYLFSSILLFSLSSPYLLFI